MKNIHVFFLIAMLLTRPMWMTLNPRDFNLGRLLDDVEDMFRLNVENKQLQLVFPRAPDVPLALWPDELKLRQVIINLLNNALKFAEYGGVTVRVRGLTVMTQIISTYGNLCSWLNDRF